MVIRKNSRRSLFSLKSATTRLHVSQSEIISNKYNFGDVKGTEEIINIIHEILNDYITPLRKKEYYKISTDNKYLDLFDRLELFSKKSGSDVSKLLASLLYDILIVTPNIKDVNVDKELLKLEKKSLLNEISGLRKKINIMKEELNKCNGSKELLKGFKIDTNVAIQPINLMKIIALNNLTLAWIIKLYGSKVRTITMEQLKKVNNIIYTLGKKKALELL